ncbi:MAG: chemotaxis protein [Pseudomonadota bacterium]
MSTLDRDEFTAGYLIEADEHVRSTVSNLLAVDQALRTDAPQHRYVRELFRALHTLKGLSAMVGIDPVVDIAHEMEAILRDADTGIAKLTPQAVELLLQGVRAIEVRIELFAKRQAITVAPRGLLAALTELQVHVKKSAPPAALIKLELEPELVSKLLPLELEHLSQSVASGKRCLRVFFHPTPELSAQGLTITSVRSQLAEIAEIVKVIPTSVPKTAATPAGLAFALLLISAASDDELARAACTQPSMIAVITRKPGTEPEAEAALAPLPTLYDDEPGELVKGNRSFIRVEIERLDDALEKLSALVVTRFKLTHALTKLRDQGVDVRELAGILSENQRQLRDLRRAITRARMVSVAELLERVPLIVRGMRSSSGKQVKLVMNAGNAELDKSVAERAFPAIVHLVRNAVDHAIESAPERQKLGKPSEGTITVECFAHSDTQLEIHVSDDGRGIDPVALGRRAGRETPLDARGMLELITLPGLSTLDVATNTSGRGMGMDIVRRIAVDMLGGDLTLKTQLGQGTTFTMRLPLSISILESF